MPQFVFEITEDEWQRFAHVMNISSVYAQDDAEYVPLTFDESLRRIFLFGLYHLEHEVLGGSDHRRDGKLDMSPDVAGGKH